MRMLGGMVRTIRKWLKFILSEVSMWEIYAVGWRVVGI